MSHNWRIKMGKMFFELGNESLQSITELNQISQTDLFAPENDILVVIEFIKIVFRLLILHRWTQW